MDTLTIFFGYDEIKRSKYSLSGRREENEKINAFGIINSKLYSECEKNK
ncbi:MAG: hypothetical protein ACFE9C_13555 [Candidatus Hodarchaeota archaeon]